MDSEAPHYTFVAPKKAYKNAIKRNKYRRIGYNILRQLPITHGTAIFMYKKEAISAKKEEIQGNILFLLKKVRVLD